MKKMDFPSYSTNKQTTNSPCHTKVQYVKETKNCLGIYNSPKLSPEELNDLNRLRESGELKNSDPGWLGRLYLLG